MQPMKKESKYQAVGGDTWDEVDGLIDHHDDPKHCDFKDLDDRVLLERRIKRLKRTAAVLAFLVIIAPLTVYALFRLHTQPVPLGADPTGFVPQGIGEPVRWTIFDENDPYWVDEDTFDSIEKINSTVKRLKATHNATTVRTNGRHAFYLDYDGKKHRLEPSVGQGAQNEMYAIRGLHQIHCVIAITEEFGYRTHGLGPHWPSAHIAHCLNTLKLAAACLADATPISFTQGPHKGHTTDGQQIQCRDYAALRNWANEPERIVRWQYFDNTPYGDRLVEVSPVPSAVY